MKCKLVSNQGNYGKVYVLESNKVIYGHKKCILKVNKDEDVSLFHEYNVMKALEKHKQLKGFFPLAFACYTRRHTETNLKEQFLYSQYVPHDHTLDDVIVTLNVEQKKNIYNHLVCMLKMAQAACRFTHYDLHFNNILLQRSPNEKRTYEFEGNKVTLSFTPFKPIIIDFGFSHADNVPCHRGPLTQTHHFMNPLVYCPYYDIYSLKRRWSREGLTFDGVDTNVFKRTLRTSLFDFLCNLLHCSNEPLGEQQMGEKDDVMSNDMWTTVDKWKSQRTIKENVLFGILFNLKADEKQFDLKTCASRLNHVDILFDDDIESIIHCLIREYLKIYKRYYREKEVLMKQSSSALLLK